MRTLCKKLFPGMIILIMTLLLTIPAFAAELESRLDCPVISDIDDYFFPYNCFFDTKYRLNEVGARLRTEQLIRDLQKWLNP